VAKHDNPPKLVPKQTSLVAAKPWHISFGVVMNGEFMMVPGTVAGSPKKLENVQRFKPAPSWACYQLTARPLLLWTEAYLSLAVVIRGGQPDGHCVALANLDAANVGPSLSQLGLDIANNVNAKATPDNVWLTLIYDANLAPPDSKSYFDTIEGKYKKVPDKNKNIIAGYQKAAAVHFDGYVGELTPFLYDLLKDSESDPSILSMFEDQMRTQYYNNPIFKLYS